MREETVSFDEAISGVYNLLFHEIAAQSTTARKVLLRGSKNAFGVIPWLDHSIQKNNLKY
ncbi:hypothetical protein [Rickettsia endosymbiont of Ixodes pacificus]|nr:hypothetical protein [Rickettsia endosymbiont of Ixodes pacificus]